MIEINFNNIEELIFLNKSIRDKLKDFSAIFANWQIAYQASLKTLRQKSLLDLLEKINETHVDLIEKHFGDKVTINKLLDYKSIRNYDFTVEEVSNELNSIHPRGNCVAYRKGNQLYLSFWK